MFDSTIPQPDRNYKIPPPNILLYDYDETQGTVCLNGGTGPVDDMVFVAQAMVFEREAAVTALESKGE